MKRGALALIIVMIVLYSTVSIAQKMVPDDPPPTITEMRIRSIEESDLSNQDKEEARKNFSEEHMLSEEEYEEIKEMVEIESSQERKAESEGILNERVIAQKGTITEQDYAIESISLPTTDHVEIKICNIGTPIEGEKTLSVSMSIELKDEFVELARIRPRLSFDENQCALTGLTMEQLYTKFDLKIGNNMKFLADADGKFKESDEYNNVAMYSFGSENVVDEVYRVAGPAKLSPLSPQLTALQTAVVIDEGACSDIPIGETSHTVCLLSDNFLVSKLTIDGFEDSIIHLWSWDWSKANVNDVEVETTGEFYILTQV